MFKDLFEGKPIKHPIHPMLVHFPIALFTLSFLLDIATFFVPLQGLYQAAFYSMVTGLSFALIAAIPGLVDYSDIRADHPAKLKARWHMILNFALVAVFAVDAWIRSSDLLILRTPIFPFVLSVIGIILLSVSGYLGGALIYDDGIAVGRHRRRTRTPDHTVGIALPPSLRAHAGAGPQLVAVADADSLHDGESLRVDLGGTVLAVVKSEGAFYAVQEFCTHRFGPLSEGRIEHGHVECPWHGSCFDLRSGKVLEGPAKGDLKTYPVRVRDGKICIELSGALSTVPTSR